MDNDASMIREITVYSCGDSNLTETWSNVPYMFCKTLEDKGIKINRVNIEPLPWLNRLYNRISYTIFQRILKQNACPTYARRKIHRMLTRRILKSAAKQYPNSDLNLFLSYAFINRFSDKPNIMWCDWTDRIVIERIGREPKPYERKSLLHEDHEIKDADIVYSMFPVCAKNMSQTYNRDVRYLGINVVNTVCSEPYDMSQGCRLHYQSNHILFVGGIKYKSGLYRLIEAISELNKSGYNICLDVIGINSKQSEYSYDWITYHGYLNKNNKAQCDLYYTLMRSARIFVNPTPGWAGYSSSIEAMYYGSPIIVSPYDDFVEEMGTDISFGHYVNDSDNLTEIIKDIMDSNQEEYKRMSVDAAERVSDYTWKNYVDCLMKDIFNVLTNKKQNE